MLVLMHYQTVSVYVSVLPTCDRQIDRHCEHS